MDLTSTLVLITLIVSAIALVLSVAVIYSVKFQKKQKEKYNEVIDIINRKRDRQLEVKDYLTIEEIEAIDDTVDARKLLSDLYDTFLRFEKNVRELNNNFDDTLTGFLKNFYEEKINNFKDGNYRNVTDKINLIGSAITEFDSNELQFRLNITCVNYKERDHIIVSGSDVNPLEQIYLITYERINDKWLISHFEKIYEKKTGI